MRLSATFLTDFADVNIYRESEQFEMTEGDSANVYIQLRDISVQTAFQGYKNPGRRYVPAVSATLSVQIDTLDDAQVATLTKTATQPYPTRDPSIWMFQIASTDNVRGTKRIKLHLTEGAKITNGVINAAILSSEA